MNSHGGVNIIAPLNIFAELSRDERVVFVLTEYFYASSWKTIAHKYDYIETMAFWLSVIGMVFFAAFMEDFPIIPMVATIVIALIIVRIRGTLINSNLFESDKKAAELTGNADSLIKVLEIFETEPVRDADKWYRHFCMDGRMYFRNRNFDSIKDSVVKRRIYSLKQNFSNNKFLWFLRKNLAAIAAVLIVCLFFSIFIMPDFNYYQKRRHIHNKAPKIDLATEKEINKIASQITPERENEFIEKANSFTRKGDYKNALMYYDAVVKVNPENSRVYYNRAAAKINLKDYAGAAADASRSIEIKPTRYGYYNRICAYYENGEWQKALDEINNYISSDWPDKKDWYVRKGYCLSKLKRYSEAVDVYCEYEPLVNSQEDKRHLYQDRGYCYEKLGIINKAKADYTKAAELGSKYASKRLKNLEDAAEPDDSWPEW